MGNLRLDDIYITQRMKVKLAEIGSRQITTIIAPMGYGKTTAVKWWSTRRTKSNESSQFFKLTVISDSVADLWSGICRIFRGHPDVHKQLKALGFPTNNQSLYLFADIMNSVLAEYDDKEFIYFIIDDIHILPSSLITSFIFFFEKNMAGNVRFVLMSRNQIFNEKEKMELGNRLYEISYFDLRLDADELHEYAEQCGIRASSAEIDELADMSEGWLSVIYLNFKAYEKNKKWLSVSSDIISLIKEVLLDPLDEERREFLILMSISDEFTKEQAAYLWEGHGGDSEKLLNYHTKNNAFITKTDNHYRYHHMLRECTQHLFSKKPEEYRRQSCTRLGDWYMMREDYLHAYFAYAKAENYGKLLSCFEKDGAFSINIENRREFFSWFENCPEEILLQHPSALTIGMLTMFAFNNIEGLYRLKELLLKSLGTDVSLSEEEKNNLLGDAEISESMIAFNNISAMSEYHRRACALLTRPTYSVNPNDTWTFESPSVLMLYHRQVGAADSENKEMKDCMPYYYRVSDGHGSGAEHCFEAELYYERGDFIRAEISNKTAISAARKKRQFSIILACEFLNARLAMIRGGYDEIEKTEKNMRETVLKEKQYSLMNTVDICRMFFAAVLNRPQSAPEWLAEGRLEENPVSFPAMPILRSFYNQLLLAKGEYTEIIAAREECENLYGVFSNILCIIRLHIQLAAAFEKIGRSGEASAELKTALDMAMPDGIAMPFAENAEYISKQLAALKKEKEYTGHIDRILELADRIQVSRNKIIGDHFEKPEDYGLSERELEIAKLAALRMTSAEIAGKLHLSEGTVRNHLSRIYNKMGIVGAQKNKRLELEKYFKDAKTYN